VAGSQLTDFDRFLDTLPGRMVRSIIKGGMLEMANVVADEARALAPKESGEMANAIEAVVTVSGTEVRSKVRLTGMNAMKGIWAEFSTAAHVINKSGPGSTSKKGAKPGKGSLVINGQFAGPTVNHPGARAKPFMRPAADIAMDRALAAGAGHIRSSIERRGFVGNFATPTLQAPQ
jgi:hypothetical protein